MSAEIEVGQTWVLKDNSDYSVEILKLDINNLIVWIATKSEIIWCETRLFLKDYTLKPKEEIKKGDICFFWNDDKYKPYIDRHGDPRYGIVDSKGLPYTACRKVTPEDLV